MDYDLDVDPALAAAVLELEAHLAAAGWDQPARLYALVETAELIDRQPELASALGLDEPAEQGSLTSVEQEGLDPAQPLEELPSIAWPAGVAGCAAMVERLVLPPSADGDLPADPAGAAAYASEHPDRQEVRIVAGVTRHGASYCALRSRMNDEDSSVMGGTDLVPSLLELLRATLEEEETS